MISIIKRKANWLEFDRLMLRQYWVSMLSFTSLPFAKFEEDAAKKYFTKIYNGHFDPLLFDGKKGKYLEQIDLVLKLDEIKNKTILDIGCGNGIIYKWLSDKNTSIDNYIGFDFAHQDLTIGENARILNTDIINVDFSKYKESNLYFLVNSMCYLNDEKISHILRGVNKDDELIIVDPIPCLFWDAHFDGVKIFYRTPNKVIEMLLSFGFSVSQFSTDYQIKIKNKYFVKLSYCLKARKIQ